MADEIITNKLSTRKKSSEKNAIKKMFKINRNKYNQSEANHNTSKL